ncbi:MAG: hypothetical protein ABII12_15195 [Planctomycetota bacterium]
MTRVLRRPKRRRAGYGESHIRQLLTGFDFFGDAFGREDRGTLDLHAMREGWELLRDELLPKWIEEHPGTRPAAWWLFDSPQRRRRTDSKPHPFANPERRARVEEWRRDHPDVAARDAYRLWFGKPACLIVLDDFDAAYEPERTYLERLGLLTEDEQAAILYNRG